MALTLKQLNEDLRIAVLVSGSMEEVITRAATRIYDNMTAPDATAVLRLILAEAHRFPQVSQNMFEETHTSLAPLINHLNDRRDTRELTLEQSFDAAYMLSTLALGGVRMFLYPLKSKAQRDQWIKAVVTTMLNGWLPRRNGG